MPTPTYIPIANTTLGSDTATVNLTGISTSYASLIVLFEGKTTSNGPLYIRFNSDTGTNYAFAMIESVTNNKYSYANSAYGSEVLVGNFAGQLRTTNKSSFELTIVDYTLGSKQRAGYIKLNGGNASQAFAAFRYNSTSAITTISFSSTGSFAAGSIFEIYGVN